MNSKNQKITLEESIKDIDSEMKNLYNSRNIIIKSLNDIEDKIVGNKEALRKAQEELEVLIRRKFPSV